MWDLASIQIKVEAPGDFKWSTKKKRPTLGYNKTRKKLQTFEISSAPYLPHLFRQVSSCWSSLFSVSWPQIFTELSGSRIQFSFPVKHMTLCTMSSAWDLQVVLETTQKKWVNILSSIKEGQGIKEAWAATKEHNKSVIVTPVSKEDSFSKLSWVSGPFSFTVT